MSYKKGDLQINEPDDINDLPCYSDSRDWNKDELRSREVKKGEAYLPHSCDQWVIGGPEEVKLLISDLREFLDGF
jgi:hypothetical protein